MIRKITLQGFNTTRLKFIVLLLVLLSSFLLVSLTLNAQDTKLLWRHGKADGVASEFTNYKTANPEAVSIPSDWATRATWDFMSKGLKGSSNPVMNISYNLSTVPANGIIFSFKLLDADRVVPEMAVFSNSVMAGI